MRKRCLRCKVRAENTRVKPGAMKASLMVKHLEVSLALGMICVCLDEPNSY